jgi:hypothetical protein
MPKQRECILCYYILLKKVIIVFRLDFLLIISFYQTLVIGLSFLEFLSLTLI